MWYENEIEVRIQGTLVETQVLKETKFLLITQILHGLKCMTKKSRLVLTLNYILLCHLKLQTRMKLMILDGPFFVVDFLTNIYPEIKKNGPKQLESIKCTH